MEGILHYLRGINPINNGIFWYLPYQLVSRISAINSMTGWKMIQFLLQWSFSSFHSFILGGCILGCPWKLGSMVSKWLITYKHRRQVTSGGAKSHLPMLRLRFPKVTSREKSPISQQTSQWYSGFMVMMWDQRSSPHVCAQCCNQHIWWYFEAKSQSPATAATKSLFTNGAIGITTHWSWPLILTSNRTSKYPMNSCTWVAPFFENIWTKPSWRQVRFVNLWGFR